MAAPQPEPQPISAADPMVRLVLLVPQSWRNELVRAAQGQRISTGALCRMVLRQWLRGRLTDEERATLEQH